MSEVVIEPFYLTVLLKSWEDELTATATILCGISGCTEDERRPKLRVNKASLPDECFQIRNESNARITYDAQFSIAFLSK